MYFWLLIFLIGLAFFTRIMLVVFGLYKEPVLRGFERYGEAEGIFQPFPSILYGFGTMLLSGGIVIGKLLDFTATIFILLGMFVLTMAYVVNYSENLTEEYPHIFKSLPRWYYELLDRTDRYDRRQIAYMWLWLPRRTRLTFNSNTKAFFQWVDMVMVANTRREGEEDASNRRVRAMG